MMFGRLFGSLVFFLVSASIVQANEDADVVTESPDVGSSVLDQQKVNADFAGAEEVDALLYFAEPDLGVASTSKPVSLPVGRPASLSVSLINKAKSDSESAPSFVLHSIEAALHYPHHYGVYIQNFTQHRLQNTIEPGQEASVSYRFWPHNDLVGQAFDLCVIINYYDRLGSAFRHSLFNRTVSLYEVEEPYETEAIFKVILEIGVVLVLLIGAYQWLFNGSSQSSSTGSSFGSNSKQNLHESIGKNTKHNINRQSSASEDLDINGVPSEKPVNEYAALIAKQSQQKASTKKDKNVSNRNQGRR